MIEVGDYVLRPDEKTFQVTRINCPIHGPVRNCRVMVDCGDDGVATVESVCPACPETVVMVCAPAEKPAHMQWQGEALRPLPPLSSEERALRKDLARAACGLPPTSSPEGTKA